MTRPARVRAVAVDFGGTISGTRVDYRLRQKPVAPDAVGPLRWIAGSGRSLVLSSNTLPCEDRWAALQEAGIDGLFTAAISSYWLGVAKPEPLFYKLVLAAAGCEPGELLHVGDHLVNDVAAPRDQGMQAALLRPRGLQPAETLPAGAHLITHLRDLVPLLEER